MTKRLLPVLSGALLLALLLTALAALPQGAPVTQASIPATIPTPRLPGVLGDICSLKDGCTYESALAIKGNEDEQQLTIDLAPTQTAKPLLIETSAGVAKFSVDPDGLVYAAGGSTVPTLTGGTGAFTVSVTSPSVIGGTGAYTVAVTAPSITASSVVSTAALNIGTVAFTGPFHAGLATNVVTGTTIAHTLGVTPTVCLITPSERGFGAVVTGTAKIIALDAISFTVGVLAYDGTSNGKLNAGWLCVK
jgi:hypothetical protein